jgi:MYXO-CTERM domain-containing protein
VTWVDQDPPFTEARPSIYGGLIETAPDRPLEFGQRVRISQSEGEQDLPDIASNGVGYLVAWEQLAGPPNYSDIYVARVSRDGDVLDMGGFPAVDRPDSQEAPAVSSDGQNYLVLWHDSHEVDHADIHAVRIGSDGALLDTGSIRLSDARRGDYEPAATFDGENYVVMWSRNALGLATGNIVALALRPDGELVDTLGGTEMELGRHPTLATTTGGMSLAAWSANNRELGLIPRVVVSPFGVDTDGDGLSDVVDDDPNNPREEEEPEDECDVGSCADAGSNMAPDTVDSTDVDVWQTGDGSDRGCNCTSSEGSLPWGSMVVVAVFLAAARLFQRRR